ncbi:MAG: hypothetical protein PHF84_07255 [bacterium]|nr:hypothetical protein [bacterium]
MKITKSYALLLLVAATLSSCSTLSITEIRLSKEDYSAVVRGSVIRGQRDLYSLAGEEGQTLGISITSPENNAVMVLYQPGASAAEKDGIVEVTGKVLPGAGETDNATTWKGPLPVSGKYLVSVSPVRGNTAYEIKIMVR